MHAENKSNNKSDRTSSLEEKIRKFSEDKEKSEEENKINVFSSFKPAGENFSQTKEVQ